VPIALDDDELVPAGVLLPDELHAATPRVKITARPIRTLGLIDLCFIV
jgi:hypothetical protein